MSCRATSGRRLDAVENHIRSVVFSQLALTSDGLSLAHSPRAGMQRSAPLAEVPGLLREFGVRPVSILGEESFSADGFADRDAVIPYVIVDSLLADCARVTGCQHFGLMAGSRCAFDDLGLPGEIARSSATIGKGIASYSNWEWLNSTGGTAFLCRDNGITGFGYSSFKPGSAEGTFQLHDLTLAIGVGMLRRLSGNPHWSPLEVQLSHARPADVGPYRRFFRAPLRFNAEMSAILFPSSLEDTPVLSANEARCRVLETNLSGLGRDDLLFRVHRTLRIAMYDGSTSGDTVAARAGISRRTLNRRLKEHGTTLRDALETVRFDAARQLLRDTDLAVGTISTALGYSESSTFVRAFRRWSGRSPNLWRLQSKAVRSH